MINQGRSGVTATLLILASGCRPIYAPSSHSLEGALREGSPPSMISLDLNRRPVVTSQECVVGLYSSSEYSEGGFATVEFVVERNFGSLEYAPMGDSGTVRAYLSRRIITASSHTYVFSDNRYEFCIELLTSNLELPIQPVSVSWSEEFDSCGLTHFKPLHEHRLACGDDVKLSLEYADVLRTFGYSTTSPMTRAPL